MMFKERNNLSEKVTALQNELVSEATSIVHKAVIIGGIFLSKFVWVKFTHPVRREIAASKVKLSTTMPRYQWRYKNYSIISPSDISFNQYETYDGENIDRFRTLKEAKSYCTHDSFCKVHQVQERGNKTR